MIHKILAVQKLLIKQKRGCTMVALWNKPLWISDDPGWPQISTPSNSSWIFHFPSSRTTKGKLCYPFFFHMFFGLPRESRTIGHSFPQSRGWSKYQRSTVVAQTSRGKVLQQSDACLSDLGSSPTRRQLCMFVSHQGNTHPQSENSKERADKNQGTTAIAGFSASKPVYNLDPKSVHRFK